MLSTTFDNSSSVTLSPSWRKTAADVDFAFLVTCCFWYNRLLACSSRSVAEPESLNASTLVVFARWIQNNSLRGSTSCPYWLHARQYLSTFLLMGSRRSFRSDERDRLRWFLKRCLFPLRSLCTANYSEAFIWVIVIIVITCCFIINSLCCSGIWGCTVMNFTFSQRDLLDIMRYRLFL